MSFRPDILAGRAVILVNIEDTIDKQLRSIRARLRRFSNRIGQIGGDLFRFGLVGSIGSVLPVKEFMEFQDQLLFLQSKLWATDRQMAGLEKRIRDLGKSTSFTSLQVAKAATEFAKAGFSFTEIKDTLQPALDLARGSMVDLSTATAILANNIRTFGLRADSAADLASKFIAASRMGTLNITDLNESLKESSGTFRLLNIDIEEALGLITQLSLSSLRATKAGTSLNTAMINLARRAKEFGLFTGQTLDDELLANPLKTLTILNQELKKLPRSKQIEFLNKQTNIRGARAVTSIIIQGLNNQEKLIDQIRASSGEARKAALLLDSRLGGVFRRALSAFQELMLSVGSTAEGPLSKFGESLRIAFNEVSTFSQKNPKLIQTLLLIPPVTLAAGAAMLTFAFALDKVASMFTPIISLNGMLFRGLTQLASLNLRGLGKIGGLVKGAAGKLGIGRLLGASSRNFRPILQLRAAFIQLQRVIFSVSRGMRTFVGALTAALRASQKFADNSVHLLLNRSLGALLRYWKLVLNLPKIGAAISRTFAAIRRFDVISKMAKGIFTLGRALRGLFTVLNGIRSAVFSFSGFLTIVEFLIFFGPKIPVIRDGLQEIGQAFGDLFRGIGDAFKGASPAFKTIGLGLQDIFQGRLASGLATFKAGVIDLVNIIKNGLILAWQAFINKLDPALRKMEIFFKGLMETINLLITSVGQVLGGIGDTALAPFQGGGTGLFGAIKQLFSNENITIVFAAIGNAIAAMSKSLLGGLQFIGETLIEIGHSIRSIPLLLKDALSLLYTLAARAPAFFRISDQDRARYGMKAVQYAGEAQLGSDRLNNLRSSLRLQLSRSIEARKGAIDEAVNAFIKSLQDTLGKASSGITQNAQVAFDQARMKAKQQLQLQQSGRAIRSFFENPLFLNFEQIKKQMGITQTHPGSPQQQRLQAAIVRAGQQFGLHPKHAWLQKAKNVKLPSPASFLQGLTKGFVPNLLKAMTGQQSLWTVFKSRPPSAAALAEKQYEAEALKFALESTVGSFSSTRGNLLKIMGNDNDRRDDLLTQIAGNTNQIANNNAVFGP